MTLQYGLRWLRDCHIKTPFPEDNSMMGLPPVEYPRELTEPHICLTSGAIPSSELTPHFDSYRLFLDRNNRPVLWVWDRDPHQIELTTAWMKAHERNWRRATWHIDCPPMTISHWLQRQRA